MKFLTALLATLALSVTQPAYAQVYTQQEINYLQTMEQAFAGEVPSDVIQETLPFAHGVCAALRRGYAQKYLIRIVVVSLTSQVQDGSLSASDAEYYGFIYGASIEGAQQEICPDVR